MNKRITKQFLIDFSKLLKKYPTVLEENNLVYEMWEIYRSISKHGSEHFEDFFKSKEL